MKKGANDPRNSSNEMWEFNHKSCKFKISKLQFKKLVKIIFMTIRILYILRKENVTYRQRNNH